MPESSQEVPDIGHERSYACTSVRSGEADARGGRGRIDSADITLLPARSPVVGWHVPTVCPPHHTTASPPQRTTAGAHTLASATAHTPRHCLLTAEEHERDLGLDKDRLEERAHRRAVVGVRGVGGAPGRLRARGGKSAGRERAGAAAVYNKSIESMELAVQARRPSGPSASTLTCAVAMTQGVTLRSIAFRSAWTKLYWSLPALCRSTTATSGRGEGSASVARRQQAAFSSLHRCATLRRGHRRSRAGRHTGTGDSRSR
jgi:hypothetical protein